VTARELRFAVDHDLCMGNGRCILLASGVSRHNVDARTGEVLFA
jgi:hypothetical protein